MAAGRGRGARRRTDGRGASRSLQGALGYAVQQLSSLGRAPGQQAADAAIAEACRCRSQRHMQCSTSLKHVLNRPMHRALSHIQVEQQKWQIQEMQAATAELAAHHATTRQ